jgi:3',5'-cyclic AMP phosphodiesterase CpdA
MRAAPVVVAVVLACALGACSPEPASPTGVLRRGGQPTMLPTILPTVEPSASPGPGEPFSFAVIGDFGTGDAIQRSVAQRMCKWHDKHPFDTVITTGDNIYPHGQPALFKSEFIRPYKCLRRRGVGFHATLGNHDIITKNGRKEIEHPKFGMGGRDYVVRADGVRFVMVDSNSIEKRWLRKALVAEDDDLWTVVAFHHPVYSPGLGHGSTPGFRPSLPRLFRRKGVDLVLNGHDHLYAVTKNLKGIRYVVTGGGGAGLYECSDKSYSAKCKAVHHFLYVTAGPTRIEVTAVPTRGKPFDRFVTTGRS